MFLIIDLNVLKKKSQEFISKFLKDNKGMFLSVLFISTVPSSCDKSLISSHNIINDYIITTFNNIGGYPTADVLYKIAVYRKSFYDYLKMKT